MPTKPQNHERRYHASWLVRNGTSPLAKLGRWMCAHRALLQEAPRDLLLEAAADVSARLPKIAAREPTRRHRKHFLWLLGWHQHLTAAIQVPS